MGLTITSSAMKIFTYAAKSSMGEGVRRFERRYCMLERTRYTSLEERPVLRSVVLTAVLALVAAPAAFSPGPSTGPRQAFPSPPVRLGLPLSPRGGAAHHARATPPPPPAPHPPPPGGPQ